MFPSLRLAVPVLVLGLIALYLCVPAVLLCVAIALMTYAYVPFGRARWLPAVAIIIVLLSPGCVLAATVDVGQAVTSSIVDALQGTIAAAIAALVSFVALTIQKKFKVDIEAQYRDALTAFAQRQAASLVARGAVKVQGLKIEVSNDAVAVAANAALHAIPDALKFFGLTPEALQKRIVDMLPSQPAVAAAQAVAIDVHNPATPSQPAAPATAAG